MNVKILCLLLSMSLVVNATFTNSNEGSGFDIFDFIRRLIGGLIALKGGLIKGTASTIDNGGNILLQIARVFAGEPPYGPTPFQRSRQDKDESPIANPEAEAEPETGGGGAKKERKKTSSNRKTLKENEENETNETKETKEDEDKSKENDSENDTTEETPKPKISPRFITLKLSKS